ncbi:MAG: ribosomal protein S27AE [Candidatus Nitrosomirales archaeon]|jgi:ribosomal protein S27AE
MHVKCPRCGEVAELEDNFSRVKCNKCSLDVTYGEYVKMIAYKDPRYRDVMNDYSP